MAKPQHKPVAQHNQQAFEQLKRTREIHPRPLVFDSFCGTGRSTALLAKTHAQHLVVGIDKSSDRLSKHSATGQNNYLLLRADCEVIWQLAVQQGWQVDYHYLLYPNPWPKPGHIQRRIHGSGALSYLLQLGGTIELRSNWQLYVEEFAQALKLAGYAGQILPIKPTTALTLFEQKYRLSGHSLWAYRARLARDL